MSVDDLEPISQLDRDDLEILLSAVLPLAVDADTEAFTSVSLRLAGGALHVGATDGRTILIMSLPAPHDSLTEGWQFIIDGAALLSLIKNDFVLREIELLGAHGSLAIRNVLYPNERARGPISVLHTTYPDLAAHASMSWSTQVTLLREAFMSLAPATGLIALSVTGQSIVVDDGRLPRATLDASVDGPPVRVLLPAAALRRVLGACLGAVVSVRLNSSSDPVVVTCPAGEGSDPPADVTAVIMPVQAGEQASIWT